MALEPRLELSRGYGVFSGNTRDLYFDLLLWYCSLASLSGYLSFFSGFVVPSLLSVLVLNIPSNYVLARDMIRRENVRPPKRWSDEMNLIALAFNIYESDGDKPQSYKQALKSMFYPKWLKAMKDEMKSLYLNKTWILVPRSKDCTIVECRWLFKLKQELNGLRYKARLVAKGFTQQEGVDYPEIFAHVVKFTTVRLMLSLCAYFDWDLKQMDVKTAFLHGDLDHVSTCGVC